MAWCSLPWSRSLYVMATLSLYSHFLILAGRGCCRSLNVLLKHCRYNNLALRYLSMEYGSTKYLIIQLKVIWGVWKKCLYFELYIWYSGPIFHVIYLVFGDHIFCMVYLVFGSKHVALVRSAWPTYIRAAIQGIWGMENIFLTRSLIQYKDVIPLWR